MTEIVFSFDTEDYVNPEGADAILRIAQTLQSEGIRGCFNVVARLAETLEKWGRTDVIEALKYHEIECHSLAHSYHPTINEYTDLESYDLALEEFLRQESEALAILRRVFGQQFIPAACPPGSNTSYVAHYGYAQLGVRVMDGDHVVDSKAGRPVGFCNLWSVDYPCALEHLLIQKTKKEILQKLEEVAAQKDFYVFYNHPNMAVFTEFWDIINFNGENVPEEEWKPSPKRSPEEVEKFFENLRFLVRRIKEDPRFSIITYGDLAARAAAEHRVLTKAQLPALKQQLEADFFPFTSPDSYCLADLFHACREFLLGKEEHLCGFVYGFLEEPFAVTGPVTVTRAALEASARRIPENGWLPRSIIVGDAILGTADWLRAALAVLCGAESVTVSPDGWQIDLDQFPILKNLHYDGAWVFWDALKDVHLSRRLRLQTWTIRLPEGGARKLL